MAWEVIEHKSAPASNIFDFTSLDLSAYNRVQLLVDGLDVGTDGTWIILQLGTGGALQTSGYRYRARGFTTGSTAVGDANSTSAAHVRILGATSGYSIGNAAGESGSVRVEIGNVSTALYKHIQAQGAFTGASGNAALCIVGGILENTGATDQIRVSAVVDSSGAAATITAGTATLYGLRTS